MGDQHSTNRPVHTDYNRGSVPRGNIRETDANEEMRPAAPRQNRGGSQKREVYGSYSSPARSGAGAAPQRQQQSASYEAKRASRAEEYQAGRKPEAAARFKLKRKVSAFYPVFLLVLIVFGVIVGYSIGFRDIDFPVLTGSFTLDILLYTAVILLTAEIQINIHELGHFFFGKKKGFKLIKYNIGFLTWKNVNGKMKFFLEGGSGSAALCTMIPKHSAKENKEFESVYSGGIIFNALALILGVGLLYWSYTSGSQVLLYGMVLSVLMSMAIIIANLIPVNLRGEYSDGKLLLGIRNKKPYMELVFEVQRAYSALLSGVRPYNLYLSRFDADKTEFSIYWMQKLMLLFYKSIDNYQYEIADYCAALIEQNVMKLPKYSRGEYFGELVFYYSLFNENQEKAEYFYKKVKKYLKRDNSVTSKRITASYELFVNHDAYKAEEAINEGLRTKGDSRLPGFAVMEKDLLLDLKEMLGEKSLAKR